MADNELLLAISDLMDKKNNEILSEINTLDQKINTLDQKISTLDQKVGTLDQKVNTLDQKVNTLDQKFNALDHDVSTLKQEVRRNSVLLENDVVPRLQNIENCYMDTYKRYQENNEKMEQSFTDIKLLKQIVAEHSEKLKKLA